MLPICLISIVGFVASSWGTQFYITCIEALIFLLTFIVISIIEFKTAKMHGYNMVENPDDDNKVVPENHDIEKANKERILKELLGRIFGEKGFDNHKIDECVKDDYDYIHDRMSLPDRERNPYDSDDESEMSRHPFSYPVSPRTRAQIEEPMFPFPGLRNGADLFPDNVYCDSKPPNPLKKKVPSNTAYTQTFAKEGLMGGAFNINEDFFDKDTHNQRRPKHRKRRNAYYNEVEAEDEDGFMGLSSKPRMLGVIYEEDEHGRKVRKSIYADSDSEYDGPDSVPITHPDPMDKRFNEHSIMGEFDKDEKGNIILLTDAKGNLVCKNGRKVNEKGYLRDRYGHILYGSQNRVRAFGQKDLDERGEIPLPYSWDRYNFNVFDIAGNINLEELNRSLSKSNELLTDANGYQVNKIGLLTDQSGNMISRSDGEIKLDTFQLTTEGDIPMLYTYEGRKFHIQQCVGNFERDEDGNVIILSQIDEEGNSKYVDKNTQEVTEKGYLCDAIGNVITKDGTVIFEKHEVSKKGEIPKILPYTKFNVDEIRGDLDKDENGKFELIHENEKGEVLDKKSRKVNAKGYLIDNEGNILDQRGNRVFDCDLIDDTGEIPKVFRLGLLRSDSTTSLNRFLDELENIKHNLGLDEDELDSGFEEEEKLLMETSDIENKSRQTSENNSAMADRPSNYNIANLDNIQSFGKNRDSNMESSFSSDDFDIDDPDFLEAIKEKRHRRRIRRSKYKRPKKKDVMLANAYGGVPRGAKVDKTLLESSRSSKQRMVVAGRINRGDRSIHGDSALDIRKDRPYTKSSKKTLEVDTKINFKPAEDQRRIGDSDLGLHSMHDESGIKEKSLGGTLMMIDPNKETLSQNSDRAGNPRGLSKNPRGKKKRNRTKGRIRRNRGKEFGSVAPDNLEKVYEKNVDDFLNDSDWDIESANNRSQASYKSARSYGDKRIRGLESIYLQRLEAGIKNKKKKKKKPRFRALQDRYLNQDEIPRDEDMTSSIFSEDRR